MTETQTDSDAIRERLQELVEDLRIAMPGAQVLFGFLLTLPFTSRFTFVTAGAEKGVYFLAFVASALASVFLIAPSALHRVYHELGDPGGLASLLRVAGLLAVAGASFVAISMAAAGFLVTDALYQRAAAAVVAAGLLGLTTWFWFALPLTHHLRR